MRQFIIVVALISSLVMSYYHGQRSVANAASTQVAAVQKWLVVDSHYQEGDKEEHARRWLVSPEGEWLIIPAAHKGWADKLIEGQEVSDMPEFVREWDRAVFPEPKQTAALRDGVWVKVAPHSHLVGKFFFVK